MQRCGLVGPIAAALAAIAIVVPKGSSQPLDFYKLSLQWPPATCNARPNMCITPYLSEFTIHGLWPQYFPDSGVPPYAQNPSCTNVTPTTPSDVINQIQPGTKSQLTTEWPNLKDYNTQSVNEQFWQYEWGQHGMCSAWPNQPDDYFNAALQLKSGLEPQGVSLRTFLAGAGFAPDAQSTYFSGDIAAALVNQTGATPEISCNVANNVIQLWEIRFCYQKDTNLEPGILMDCPTQFSSQCSGASTQISFPPS